MARTVLSRRAVMKLARLSLGVLAPTIIVSLASPAGAATAASGERTASTSNASATDGARFQAGVFGLAHARRPDEFPESTGFLPGLALGGAWSIGAWELGGLLRAAYFREERLLYADSSWTSSRKALFGALGARARWFSAPSASLTPYVELGADFSLLFIDEYMGAGPSAHVGAGLEVWHDRPHHRLAIGLGVDVPAYRAVNAWRTSMAGSWASSNDPVNGDHFWAVPVSLAARWTF